MKSWTAILEIEGGVEAEGGGGRWYLPGGFEGLFCCTRAVQGLLTGLYRRAL